MERLPIPDQSLLEGWLKAGNIRFELCGQCEGLHLGILRGIEGVSDSRLFLENYGIVLTTEIEVRPTAVLSLAAHAAQLNMDFPTLKVFLDVADESLPQLVAAGVLPSAAGLTQEQCCAFIDLTMEETRQLAALCQEQEYLLSPAADEPAESAKRIH